MNCIISVVIPVFNSEKEILNTVKPFLVENSGIELIFIDDASCDNSLKILHEIKENNKHIPIKVHNQGKLGVSCARNKGIELAEGEYIYFCDSDDEVDSSLITKLKKSLSHDVDMVVWQHCIRRNDSIQHLEYTKQLCEVGSNYQFFDDFITDKFRLCMGTFAIRRQLLIDKEIRYTQGCQYGEDLEFIMKSILNSTKIICIPEELYTYIRRDSSSMGVYNIHRFDAPEMVLRILNYIDNNPFDLSLETREYLVSEYFVKQFIYSLDSCIKHLSISDYREFIESIDSYYLGLLDKAQHQIRKICANSISYISKRVVMMKISVKLYTLIMLAKKGIRL